MEDIFTIANKNFNSRLIVGTGKYKSFQETANAVKASGRNVTSKKNVSTIGKTAKNIVNRFYAEIVKKILFQVIP